MKERIENLRKQLAQRPDWTGTVIRDDTPEWLVISWERILGIWKPPYEPTYRTNITQTDGQLTWPLGASDYFATEETAELMASKFGDPDFVLTKPDGRVVHYAEVPFGGDGGIFTTSEHEYHISVKGKFKNAGLIASTYRRYPTDRLPGVADRVIREALGLEPAKNDT